MKNNYEKFILKIFIFSKFPFLKINSETKKYFSRNTIFRNLENRISY